jgi:glycerate 2-kinase
LIARPKASLDAAIKLASDAGYAIIDLGADLEGEARASPPITPGSR